MTQKDQDDKLLLQGKIGLLFTDPETSELIPFCSSHLIITKPSVIWELLILFEYLQEEKQLLIIEEISKYLEATPNNIVALVKKTVKRLPTNKTQNILEFLIYLGFQEFEKNKYVAQRVFGLIGRFFKYNNLARTHLSSIYSRLAEKFYSNQITTSSVQFAIGLLQEIFLNQAPLTQEPQNFFYFSGIKAGITLSTNSSLTWPFSNGIAMNIWFYLDEAHAHMTTNTNQISPDYAAIPPPKLFSVHCKGSGGLELFFIGTKLFYRNLPPSYDQPSITTQATLLHEFEVKNWYALGLEFDKPKMFSKGQISIVINQELKRTVNHDFPKVSSSAAVSRFIVGENLFGRISSVIIYKAAITHAKLIDINSFYNFGIQFNQQLKTINIPFEKFFEKILLLYTPIRAEEDICYDIILKHNGTMMENTGFAAKEFNKQKLSQFGGMNSFLPFFYLLRFCQREEKGPNLLNEILRLILLLLKNKPENQMEASKINFFRTVGQLLSELMVNWIDKDTVDFLTEVKLSLNEPKLSEEFFVDFLWKVDIYESAPLEARKEIFGLIKALYLRKPVYYNSLFGVSQILDLIIDRYDSKDHEDAAQKQNLENDAKPLLGIIESILIQGGVDVAEELLPLFKAFTLKLSPQLHLMIFNSLSAVLINQAKEKSFPLKGYCNIMNENRVVEDLLYLFNNTADLRLRAKCVKFTNLLLNNFPNVTSQILINRAGLTLSSKQSDSESDIINFYRRLLHEANVRRKNTDFEDGLDLLMNTSEKPFQEQKSKTVAAVIKPETKTRGKQLKGLDLEDPPIFSETTTNTNLNQPDEIDLVDKKLAVMSKNLRGRTRTFDFTRGASVQEKKLEATEEVVSNFKLPSSKQGSDAGKFRSRSGPAFDEVEKRFVSEKEKAHVVGESSADDLTFVLPPSIKNSSKGPNKKLLFPLTIGSEGPNQENEEQKANKVVPEEERKSQQTSNIGTEKGKPSFKKKMELDINSINETHTIGGEKGRRIVTDIDDEISSYYKEIAEIAKECVQYMIGEKVQTDFYQNKMPSSLPSAQSQNEGNNEMPESTTSDTVTLALPEKSGKIQSLRNKTKKPQLTVIDESNPVKEEENSLLLSKKDSNKNSKDTLAGQIKARENNQSARKGSEIDNNIDDANMEIFYYCTMEWLLGKYPSNQNSDMMIDDADQIKSPNVIEVLIQIYHFSSDFIRQKMIQDIYMLVKWNPNNRGALQSHEEFVIFLLEILYAFQVQLFDNELSGSSAAIWELGCKIHSLLMKNSINQDNEVNKRIQRLFGWLSNKKSESQGSANPNKATKAVCYLGRHLWNHLLDSLEEYSYKGEPGLDARPNLGSLRWKNFYYLAFSTEDAIISLKIDSINTKKRQNNANSFSFLQSYATEITFDDDFPFNFKNLISDSSWIDLPLVENILRVSGSLWPTNWFLKHEKLDSIDIDGKILALMDISHSEDFQKALDYLLMEPLQADDEKRGSLINLIITLAVWGIEILAQQKHYEKLVCFCYALERIFQYYLVAAENCRDKKILGQSSQQILASLGYILQFFYVSQRDAFDTVVKKEFTRSLHVCTAFLLSVVEFVNNRLNNFEWFEGLKEASQQDKPLGVVATYTMISYELLKTALSNNIEGSLITIEGIKQLKSKNFAELNLILASENWCNALTDNTVLTEIISRYYSDTLSELSPNILSFMFIQGQKLANTLETNLKAVEEGVKRCEDEVIDRAANVHEMEDTRKHQIAGFEEERVRIAKSNWRKQWKRLRVYIGQWRHPQFYHQSDKKYVNEEWDKMKPNEFFYRKIAKYETRARARPFVKVKLIEPEFVVKYNESFEKTKQRPHKILSIKTEIFCDQAVQNMFNNMDMISPGLAKVNKAFSLNFSQIRNKIKKTFFKAFPLTSPKEKQIEPKFLPQANAEGRKSGSDFDFALVQPKEEVFFTKACQWIRTLTLREGLLQVTSSKLIFIFDGIEQKMNSASMFPFKLADDKRIFKEWPLEYIKEIQRRRYITRKSALEIFLIDGTTLLFNFPSGDLEEVTQKLVRLRKTSCPNLIYFGSLEPRKILEKAPPNKLSLTKRWLNYEISNFEYLMALNSLSGRSYKDLTQYPVFPWVLQDYRSETVDLEDQQPYRDLNKNMGQLGSNQRIKIFLERFESVDPFTPSPAYHFGSHYSSPAITLQFLIRIAPFTQGHRELQGGRFDLADRLFFSMAESFKAATEEVTDVRELVPEFYYLPDFLINADRLDFGVQQTGQRVNHVDTPKWSKRNPYRFIALQRLALESEIVSRNLNNWIDLIFGYKQRGKEADKAMNSYYYLTYEDMVDLNSIKEPGLLRSTEAQVVHFGQTPSQLFTKPHPQRPPRDFRGGSRIVADPSADLRVYRPSNKKKDADKNALSMLNLPGRALIKLIMTSSSKLMGLRRDGTITFYQWLNTNISSNSGVIPFSCGIEKEKKIQLERLKTDFIDPLDRSLRIENYPALYLNSGKLLAVGGFWDGKLSILSVDQDAITESYSNHNDTVTIIISDSKENFLMSGSKSGECFVWKISPEYRLSIKYQFYDHDDIVTSIYISNELRVFASASLDGKINIYHFFTGTLLRTIFHPTSMPIHNVVLSSNPVPSVIFFSSEDRALCSYSINGQLLESLNDESIHLLSPTILKDINSIESLVYGNEKGDIYQRELPFLNIRRRLTVSMGSPVLSILLTKDRKFLLFGCGDGEISVLTEPASVTKTTTVSTGIPQTMTTENVGKLPVNRESSDHQIKDIKDDTLTKKNDNQPFILRKNSDYNSGTTKQKQDQFEERKSK